MMAETTKLYIFVILDEIDLNAMLKLYEKSKALVFFFLKI